VSHDRLAKLENLRGFNELPTGRIVGRYQFSDFATPHFRCVFCWSWVDHRWQRQIPRECWNPGARRRLHRRALEWTTYPILVVRRRGTVRYRRVRRECCDDITYRDAASAAGIRIVIVKLASVSCFHWKQWAWILQ